MQIFITGGTGFIGSALCEALVAQGHQLTVLTRQPRTNLQAVKFCQNFSHLDGFDAVINLAGEPIFDKRWTKSQKRKLWESRIPLTQKIAECIQQSENPPAIFLSGSATGIYGHLPKFAKNCENLTACNPSFAARLCQDWEAAALQAQSERTRVCLLRTGIVLDPHGGALKRMLPLYRLGLGGKLGSGKQHWAWIALQDQIRAILFLLANPNSQGVYNLIAPNPVSQREFNRSLAQKLHRPAFCHLPAPLLTFALGERASLLLDNQPLAPQRLIDEGFTFTSPSLAAYFDLAIK